MQHIVWHCCWRKGTCDAWQAHQLVMTPCIFWCEWTACCRLGVLVVLFPNSLDPWHFFSSWCLVGAWCLMGLTTWQWFDRCGGLISIKLDANSRVKRAFCRNRWTTKSKITRYKMVRTLGLVKRCSCQMNNVIPYLCVCFWFINAVLIGCSHWFKFFLALPLVSSTNPIMCTLHFTDPSGNSNDAPQASFSQQSNVTLIMQHQTPGELPAPCPDSQTGKISQFSQLDSDTPMVVFNKHFICSSVSPFRNTIDRFWPNPLDVTPPKFIII